MTDEIDHKEFRQARESTGLSQAEFARVLGVAQSTVWRWENGKQPVPRYADVLLDALLLLGNKPEKW